MVYNPIAIPLAFSHTKFPSIEEKLKILLADREEALVAHELARSQMKDRRSWTFTPFTQGQLVWLDSWNLKTNCHKKISPKWEGPFKIKEVLGPLTYQLKLPKTWRIHNIFHAILLWPYIENEIHGNNYPWPPPELLDVWSWLNSQTSLKRMGLPILYEIERISHLRSHLGIRNSIFLWWKHANNLQIMTSTVNKKP